MARILLLAWLVAFALLGFSIEGGAYGVAVGLLVGIFSALAIGVLLAVAAVVTGFLIAMLD